MTIQVKLRRIPVSDFDWKRTQEGQKEVQNAVHNIVSAVRSEGDAALRRFTAQFDGVETAQQADFNLRVDPEQLAQAYESLDPELRTALEAAGSRIRAFHEAQLPRDLEQAGPDGERLGLVWRALSRVGIYAPGGRATYPSTVLMNAIPAKVAGCSEIVLVSPPSASSGYPSKLVMAAAHVAGVTAMYRIGGAQAIAALAYGTETLPRVDKIVGPGNAYVAMAKRTVMGDVGIDSIAGPSEVFIVADESANPDFVAADMLAQAEHDPDAGAVCITSSRELADAVEEALHRQLEVLPKQEIAGRSLRDWGAFVLAKTPEESVDAINRSAPEHVELLVKNPAWYLDRIRTAGSVFLGAYTPEPVGDYYAGPNHVLPTHGSGRYASGLGVLDFLRRMTFVEYQQDTIFKHAKHITQLARAEGLDGHARAVEIRLMEGTHGN